MLDNRDQLTVGFMPHFHAQRHSRKDKAAVVCEDHRLTWDQLSTRVAKLANALRAHGIKRGDRVAVFLRNRAEYVEIIYALAGLGAAIVTISFRMVGRELLYSLQSSEVRALITGGDLLPVFDDVRDSVPHLGAEEVMVVGESPHPHPYLDYEDLLAGGAEDKDYLEADESDVFWLAFTGGTTGAPKLCEVPHRRAVQTWLGMTMEFGILEDDVSLVAGPFYHGLGFFFGLQQLMVGGTVVILPDFDGRAALQAVEREGVTFTAMAPAMYHMVLDVADRSSFDVSSLRGLVSSAAPLTSTTKRGLLEFFPAAGLYEYYGATEAGFYSVLKPKDQLRKTRCVGEPFFNSEIKIFDADGHELPTGEVGLIYKRGMRMTRRYYNNPEATRALFLGEDWVTNSDMGYLDDEGHLYLVDRMKDMIISGGVNIYSAEIEEVISWHPDVDQVAVIGVPDEKWGESVKAFVVRKPGSQLRQDDIIEHCRREMASYKKPRSVEFVTELPRNAAGKLLKRVLRDQAWGSRPQRV